MKKFRKTLIIDDDPVCRFLTKALLSEINISEEIIELPHGRAALEYIQQNCLDGKDATHCPDWILLDLNMPIMNGMELLEELAALQQMELIHQSVTILTSSASPKDRAQTSRYGVKGYLTKPLTEDGLGDLLSDLYARGGGK